MKQTTKQVIGLAAACVLCAGCGTLPGSGASRRDIDKYSGDDPDDREFTVVALDVEAIRRLGGPRPAKLNETFSKTMRGATGSILGIGDELLVNIWEASIDGLFSTPENKQARIDARVDESGSIFIPYVGEVAVAGRSVEEVRTSIQDGLAEVMKNRTTFIIAHRITTVKRADVVLVMDDGRIVQQGTHADLLAQEGAYRDFAQMQWQLGVDQREAKW